mmetsp:Transcript_16327/g.16964  ORF Transcript_16327/g.16964 Transcript_16327/m.16964 type:complete len:391 (+) Transcript_16327:12-1184(+)
MKLSIISFCLIFFVIGGEILGSYRHKLKKRQDETIEEEKKSDEDVGKDIDIEKTTKEIANESRRLQLIIISKEISACLYIPLCMSLKNKDAYDMFEVKRGGSLKYAVIIYKGAMMIAFRGTINLQNAITDAKFRSVKWKPSEGIPDQSEIESDSSEEEDDNDIRVHRGFIEAYGDKGVKDVIDGLVDLAKEKEITDIYFSGHSLGGGLAYICALDFFTTAQTKLQGVKMRYNIATYGAPRTGNQVFAKAINSIIGTKGVNMRVVFQEDLVTQVPDSPYVHAGNEVKFNKLPDDFQIVPIQSKGDSTKRAIKVKDDAGSFSVIKKLLGFVCMSIKNAICFKDKLAVFKMLDHMGYIRIKTEAMKKVYTKYKKEIIRSRRKRKIRNLRKIDS